MKKLSILCLLILAACDCDQVCDTEKQATFIENCVKNANAGKNSDDIIWQCRLTSRELFCKSKKE